MASHSQHPGSPSNVLDQWLASRPLKADPGFVERVRARIQDPEILVDILLDELPKLPGPISEPIDLTSAVRRKLSPQTDPLPEPIWFRWIMPLAAAATLAFILISFRGEAPAPDALPSIELAALPAQQDPELTRIFALAANLDPRIDLDNLDVGALTLLTR